MNIYILMKAVQKGNSLDMKCLGAFLLVHKAREAMRKDYNDTRNKHDFDWDQPSATADSAWIVADDDTFTTWSIQCAALAVDAGSNEPPDTNKDGRTLRLSLKSDDVHVGDRLQEFHVRMAREQSFTANVEAHNAAEAEIIAENFCEAMGSEKWDALSEHVHKTFEAEPKNGSKEGVK